MNEQCTKLKKTNDAISFVISFFNFEKYGVKPGFLFTQLNQATYSKLGKKSNFDMFYKNDC